MVRLKKEKFVLFMVVIYGDGEFIDNVVWFYYWFIENGEELELYLSELRFGVFGLGNW